MRPRAGLVFLALAVSLLAGGVAQATRIPDAKALIAQWRDKNALCRGLPGDSPDMQPACDARQSIGRTLDKLGWCYGKKGQAGYQMQWHRCGAGSTHYE